MTKILTDNFKTHSAKQFVESFSEPANTVYFMTGHRSVPFADDLTPPTPNTAISESFYTLYDELIFGKNVTPSDVKHMVKNKTWTSGTVYAMYDDQTPYISNTDFYVVADESSNYHVFKCLNNNGGVTSTDKPLLSETSADDELYETTDGYQWKYMFTCTAADYAQFATTEYLPLTANSNVTANAVNGTLETFVITDAGTSYNSYANGTIKEATVAGNTLIYALQSDSVTLSSNTDFYKNNTIYIRSGTGAGQMRTISEYIVTGSERRVLINTAFAANSQPDTTSVFEIAPRVVITGDGSSANAISTVNSTANSIATIEVVNRGSGYSYASVTVTANTGVLANTGATTANSAVVRTIISPKEGHGADIINELYAYRVGIGMSFANNESSTIPVDNDFRKIALLKEPLFANVELTVGASATTFTAGELVTQANTGATGYVSNRSGNTLRVANVSGFFATGNSTIDYIIGATSAANTDVSAVDRVQTTVDQTQKFTVEMQYAGTLGGGFIDDEVVSQSLTSANGYVYTSNAGANSTVITLTSVKGDFALSDGGSGTINTFTGTTSGAIAKLTGRDYTLNSLTDNSGEFVYVENMQPITRSASQTEKIKLIIEF